MTSTGTWTALFSGLLLLFGPIGCDSEGGTVLTPADQPDGASFGGNGGNGGTGGVGGIDAPDVSQPGPGVDRNEECRDPDLKIHGSQHVEWNGYETEGTTYTCNSCPGGVQDLQGRWRLVDFDTGDPEVPLAGGDREVLEFNGNTWKQTLDDDDPQYGRVTGITQGWYFCGVKPEVNAELKVFIVSAADPPGVFGFDVGGHWAGQPLFAQTAKTMALQFHQSVTSESLGYFTYCRIGTTIGVEDCGDGSPCERECTDPFDQ